MVWGRLDDKLHSHPKTHEIPLARRCEAIGLWTLVMSWCNDYGTDGGVPRDIPEIFGARADCADLLVNARLWTRTENGYQVCNWGDYNLTQSEIQEKKDAETERKRRQRKSGKRSSEGDSGSETSAPPDPADSPASVPLGHPPDTTRNPAPPIPIPIPKEKELRSPKNAAHKYDDDFQDWWEGYPKKVGKAEAQKEYRSARKKVDASTLTAALASYAKSVASKESDFIIHAKRWLKNERWEDEDLQPVTAEFVLKWLRKCYEEGDTKSVADRAGMHFQAPEPPEDVTDLKEFNAKARKAWIHANKDVIVDEILRREAA